MNKIIVASILFLVSVFAFVVSVRSFLEKGFLFNNAYLYASEQERERMNKKPHYRQSAIVFLAIGLIFLLNGLDVIFRTGWLFYVIMAIVIVTLVYAVVSGVIIEKNNKQK